MDVVRQRPNQGWIEVIVGSMFSGKSEELIRRLRRAQIARQKVQIFKPAIDVRFAEDHIVSHSEMRIPSVPVASSRLLLDQVEHDTEVVGIDEGQFFDHDLPAVCNTLADQGKRVIVAGLDQDFLGKPFEPMPQLLAIAEYITKTLAICMICGNPANHTQRLVASEDRVLVGAGGLYEARCRVCFNPRLAETRAGAADVDAPSNGPENPIESSNGAAGTAPADSVPLRPRVSRGEH
jgi:thymidine kinase